MCCAFVNCSMASCKFNAESLDLTATGMPAFHFSICKWVKRETRWGHNEDNNESGGLHAAQSAGEKTALSAGLAP